MNGTRTHDHEPQFPLPRIPPPVACLLHYILVGSASMAMHDALVGQTTTLTRLFSNHLGTPPTRVFRIGIFFGIYAAWLLAFRLSTVHSRAVRVALSSNPGEIGKISKRQQQSIVQVKYPAATVWYEMTWLCNVTLVMAAGSLVSNRWTLACAYGLTVAIDQLLWYVDGVVFCFTFLTPQKPGRRRTLVGVFEHLLGPEIRWIDRLTCFHHLWTLPLLVVSAQASVTQQENWESEHNHHTWLLSTSHGDYRYFYRVWILSAVVMVCNVVSSRLLVPYGVLVSWPRSHAPMIRHRPFFHYLNVNLSREIWRNLSKSIAFLHIQHDSPGTLLYLFRLLTRWMLLNTIILIGFLVLVEISR